MFDFTNLMQDCATREEARPLEVVERAAWNMSLVANSLACDFHPDLHNDPVLVRHFSDAWHSLYKAHVRLKALTQ